LARSQNLRTFAPAFAEFLAKPRGILDACLWCMTPQELRTRTRRFAVAIVRFCRSIPKSDEGRVISRQLIRSGASVGANYRAVCRPRSDADFIAKLGVVIEECDETAFWSEVLVEAEITNQG
jgi:four helix bundle protein